MAGKFRRGKYNVAPKDERTEDGIVFDSKKECLRYRELKLLSRAGEIKELQRQVHYPCEVKGHHITTYRADFRYFDSSTGNTVVEDVKGVRTPEYKLKKKLVEALYRIEIIET